MAKSNDELLAIRDESYRVVHVEVCRTCRHWHSSRMWYTPGVCRIAESRDSRIDKETDELGTCDLWEGNSDQ